jgi:hypothetical protein
VPRGQRDGSLWSYYVGNDNDNNGKHFSDSNGFLSLSKRTWRRTQYFFWGGGARSVHVSQPAVCIMESRYCPRMLYRLRRKMEIKNPLNL